MHRPQFARILTLSLIALTAACGDDKGSDGTLDAGGSGDTEGSGRSSAGPPAVCGRRSVARAR